MSQIKQKMKKIIGIIINILLVITTILIVIGVYYLVQIKVLNNNYADIFGYTFFEVATGSMGETIKVGDVVIVKVTDQVEVDEIIVYKDNEDFVTHRLIEKNADTLIAKGDANNSEDKPIKEEQILGKVICILPQIGIWRDVLFSPEILGLVVLLILILMAAFFYTGKRRKIMSDKRKKMLYAKLIILIICLLIVIRIFVLVFSKYESQTESVANVDIAFYLLKEDYQTMSLNLASMFPQDESYEYVFTIGNEDGDKVAEIDLKYDLKLRMTTNLPLTYQLYMNNQDAIVTNTIQADADGTYFREITTNTVNLKYTEPKTNTYRLVINFPAGYNTENYQDIIEMLEITVNSEQVTS